MNQPMLTEYEGDNLRMFEGKRVVPRDSGTQDGHYREWLVTALGTHYCIVNEGDTWTLMYYVPDVGAWCDAPDDVDVFLSTHKLILAA
jgi:hypothetical protein